MARVFAVGAVVVVDTVAVGMVVVVDSVAVGTVVVVVDLVVAGVVMAVVHAAVVVEAAGNNALVAKSGTSDNEGRVVPPSIQAARKTVTIS